MNPFIPSLTDIPPEDRQKVLSEWNKTFVLPEFNDSLEETIAYFAWVYPLWGNVTRLSISRDGNYRTFQDTRRNEFLCPFLANMGIYPNYGTFHTGLDFSLPQIGNEEEWVNNLAEQIRTQIKNGVLTQKKPRQSVSGISLVI